MRLFLHSDQEGNLLSAIKVTVMVEDLEHPYGDVGEDQRVVEIQPTAELEHLSCHEICDRYILDLKTEQLNPKE